MKNSKTKQGTTKKILFALLALTLSVSSCRKDDEPSEPQPQALSFSNGGISSGTVSSGGVTAPSGYTWSENMTSFGPWGYNAVAAQNEIADEINVPAGEKWTIENVIFYAYKTGFTGTSLPMGQLYLEVYSSNPSSAGATKVYGDATTNRYVSNEEAKVFRIATGQPANQDRKVFKVKAQTPGLVLNPGTYWLKWSSKLSDNTSHFYVNVTPATNPLQYNALQFTFSGSTWANVKNGSDNVDMAFQVEGKKTVN